MIQNITQTFNNREIAIFFWIILFFGWILSHKSMRKSTVGLIKSFMVFSILTTIFCMLVYISTIILFFNYLAIWDFSLLKDTIYWTFGFAFIQLVNINDSEKDEKFFKKTLLNSFKIIVIIEFLTNLYTFSLVVELIALPLILIFTMVSTYSENKEENRAVKKLSDTLLSLYGITVLSFSIYHAILDFSNLATINNLKSLLMGPVLTGLYIPYMYFVALFMTYESFLKSRKWILKDNKELFRFLRWYVLRKCNFSLAKIHLVSRKIHIYRNEEKSKIIEDINLILNE